jgi:multidrug efflux pump subunit AcrA (membrane-fusion protein)
MSQPDATAARHLKRRLRWFLIVFGGVAILVAGYGLISRAATNAKLRDLTDARAVPIVAIVTPTRVENQSGLELPGRLQAFIRAPIYARVPGYLKTWKHDIGSKVKAGDLLAEIDTPDLDQQLKQARGSPRSAGSRSPAPTPSPGRMWTSGLSR